MRYQEGFPEREIMMMTVIIVTYNFCLFVFCFCLSWVFVAVHGLFSSCGERGLFFIAVCGLLIAVASLVAELGL